MTKLRRIANLVLGLAMIAGGVILLLDPTDGLLLVAVILGLALVLYGVRKLVYYITMARHMAGGLSVLFIAVIAIDIGSLSLVLINDPKLSIVLYLVGYNTFTGVLTIARAIEARMLGSRWKLTFVHGVVNIVLAVLCFVFIGSDQIVIAIFCFGLFYGACVRIASAFRATDIIFIQ